jgi:glycosyltransferase involved in cell wall biosynthesis
MRIAFLTDVPSNIAGQGGGHVHVSQVAKRLINRGHQLYTNLQSEQAPLVKLTERGFLKRGKEIDVFYIRIDGWADRDRLTLLRQANAYAPCIWEVNAPVEELRTYGKSEGEIEKLNMRRKKLAGMVDVAICVSDEMEEYARDYLGIKSTFVVPNGSDPQLFNPGKGDKALRGKTKFRVLWAGSPKYRWQGLRLVQQLAETLREKKLDDIILAATAEGKSSENLLYLGHVPYHDMPRHIASADAGLCIYEDIGYYERFYFSPLKLYDYMASGIPVIGTNVGQIKHVIEEQRNGLLTDNAIDDLTEKIVFLKDNPDAAREMGLRGREAVLGKYNWDKVVLQTEAILAGAAARHGRLDKQPRQILAGAAFKYWKVVMACRFYRNALKRMVNEVRNIAPRALKKIAE